MKKINLLYTAAVTLMLSATACSDTFLNMKQDGVYDALDSETKVNWYVNALYHNLYNGLNKPNKTLVYKQAERDKYTEEAWGAKDEKKVNPNSNLFTLDDLGSNSGGDFYAGYFGTKLEAGKKSPDSGWHQIRNCNLALQELESSTLDPEFVNHAKGQLYFLRAAQMFDLVRTFGSVPIVKVVLNAEANGEKLPRESVSKCIEMIANDLTLAASLLPDKWNSENYGRVTKGAALAMKSRVLLTYASPIFNKNWNDPANHRWQMALKATQEAIQAMPEKSLEGVAGAAAWAEMLCNTNKTADNSESIFVRLLAGVDDDAAVNNSWEQSVRLPSQEGKGAKTVPLELMDAFPKADGTLLNETETAASGNIDFILNRDPRFYRTFAFCGMKWGYNEHKTDTVWAYRYAKLAEPVEDEPNTIKVSFGFSENNEVASPVFVRKMSSQTASNEENFAYSGINIYEFRYAELALNLAECYAATNDIENCKNTLGKLRARVGIEKGNHNYGLDTYINNRNSALAACLRERLIELCYEGKRCWDTWRWLLYDGGQGIGGNSTPLTLSDENTCTFLGVTPLNETCRTSRYLEAKQDLHDVSSDLENPTPDPLIAARQTVGADIDSPEFPEQLAQLAAFWRANFRLAVPPVPGDKGDNDEPINIGWKANYYISGINKEALTKNAWLGQTVGWQNTDGSMGTIGFQDDDEITVNWLYE